MLDLDLVDSYHKSGFPLRCGVVRLDGKVDSMVEWEAADGLGMILKGLWFPPGPG